MAKLIAVRAIARGFAEGQIKEVGDEFYMPEGSKASWFAPVAAESETPASESAPAPRRRRAAPVTERPEEDDPEALQLA